MKYSHTKSLCMILTFCVFFAVTKKTAQTLEHRLQEDRQPPYACLSRASAKFPHA
jgi:hypothetical protein